MSIAHRFRSCSNSYGWTNSCFCCLISTFPIQFIQCFAGPAPAQGSPSDFGTRALMKPFQRGCGWHRMGHRPVATRTRQVVDQVRNMGHIGFDWIGLLMFISIYSVYIYVCECLRITNIIHGNWIQILKIGIYWDLRRYITLHWIDWYTYIYIYNPLNFNW